MRFSTPDWQGWSKSAFKRLNIDTQCVICARQGRDFLDLCDDCESQMQHCLHTDASGYTSRLCLACGVLLSGTGDQICGNCNDSSSPFLRIVAPYRYEFPLDRLLHAFKYRNQRVLGRIFGVLLANSVRAVTPEGMALPVRLIPVPLHASRHQERGYNQSADIARWCARDLGLCTGNQVVTREFDTGSLAGLNRVERQLRILGAFRAHHSVAGQHLAIVDDVLTTGSTARELARELYDRGALSVELWVLARTSRER
ncbi:ComF family protein [Granulosicoccus antarcticus]|uniref:Phosphoribosyltransferase domain-containing protein n=1 Tax=Granulosicoccus antarcticus IMCC3135 TaxID=1192854 RepID=A0A2Z2NYR2_9GAMM|nr:phosphoribosyltransferase family protein [Granulosicoccus antarcticus]ASJ76586.1 hypothetical protein IMCC3135_32705 [Granulosicoccus antarcticus IMCC3135]